MVINIFLVLSIFWFIRETKAFLFWIYLWQLKEYHIGRLLDHFRTEKGKQLLFNKLIILKIILILFLIWGFSITTSINLPPNNVLILFLLILYFFESVKALLVLFQKKLKKPALTKKSGLLTLIGFLFQIFFLFGMWLNAKFALWLLIFDVLTPAIASGIVLIFQPLVVLNRGGVIKKAIKKRERFKHLLVIGITGSYGKTSTKEFLATILSEKFKVLKTARHQNSEIGISQCILNDLTGKHEIFVCEMGAYNRGGIKLLADIAKPKIGILTGINEQHLATFGCLENIINTKFELIQSLPRQGLAIFNGDNSHCFKLYQNTIYPKKVYSVQPLIYDWPVDIWTENIKIEKDFISFKAIMKNDQAFFKINLLGAQNIPNLLAAALVAKECGLNLEEISQAGGKIRPYQGGMELRKGRMGLNVINATYSANPYGVISHLEYLKTWTQNKVIIMPCLIELGESSKQIHKRIGQKIGQVCDLAIITTKDRFKEIEDGAGKKAVFMENSKHILEKIKAFCKKDDVVLIEGRVPEFLVKQLVIG